MGEVERFRRPKKGRNSAFVPDRYMLFLEGDIKVEDLDDDEVMRMQLKASDGSFKGQPPRAIPRELAMAFQREQQKRFASDMTKLVPDALRAMKEILNNRHPLPGDAARLKAAQTVIDRFAGKTPDKVEVKAEVAIWQQVANDILIDVDTHEEEAEEVEEEDE